MFNQYSENKALHNTELMDMTKDINKGWKFSSIHCPLISEIAWLLGGFPSFASFSFWYKQRADEDN
jgi:hypothetical protein